MNLPTASSSKNAFVRVSTMAGISPRVAGRIDMITERLGVLQTVFVFVVRLVDDEALVS